MRYESELARLFPKELAILDRVKEYIENLTDCDVVSSSHIRLGEMSDYAFRMKFRYMFNNVSVAAQFTIEPSGEYFLTIINELQDQYRKTRYKGMLKDVEFWTRINFIPKG